MRMLLLFILRFFVTLMLIIIPLLCLVGISEVHNVHGKMPKSNEPIFYFVLVVDLTILIWFFLKKWK
jgi:hypothetical protein